MFHIEVVDQSMSYGTTIAARRCYVATRVDEFDINKHLPVNFKGPFRYDGEDEEGAVRIAEDLSKRFPFCHVYVSKITTIVRAKAVETIRQAVTSSGVLPA